MGGLDALLLDAGGGDEDLVAIIQFVLRSIAHKPIILPDADADTPSRSRYPSKLVDIL